MKSGEPLDRLFAMTQLYSLFSSEQAMTVFLAIIVIAIPKLRTIYFVPERSYPETTRIQRVVFFDIAKGFAILAVILIHVLLVFKLDNRGNEALINIVNNIARFAVPVFLICTGILLHPKMVERRAGILKFYTRKIITIGIPYFIATLIISLYSKVTTTDFFYYLFTGKALGPYYYIVVLAQLYVLYPLLVIVRHNKWFLPLSFFVSLVSFHLCDGTFFLPFLYFFSYGIANREYFLSNNPKKYSRSSLWLVITIYLAFTIFWADYYYNMVYIYGVAIWNLFFAYQHQFTKSWLTEYIANMGKITLWIYLIHFPVVLLMYRLLDNSNIFLYTVGTYLSSVVISYYVATFLSMVYSRVTARIYQKI